MPSATTSIAPAESAVDLADVAVVGLGYVGLTLATSLASAGKRVVGHDANPAVTTALTEQSMPFYEAGIAETLRTLPAGRFTALHGLPDTMPPAVVLCVGTPVDPATGDVNLSYLEQAVAAIAPRVNADTVVIVRSTVSVGATRRVVLPALARHVREPLLAFCPERTIQGQALHELRSLPQVIGGLDQRSAERAAELFAALSPCQVRVSSLEAAELIKLVNNCHTDVIYAFGNEVARMAEVFGVDADEIVTGANIGYPRPDVSRPGFVGGGCLTKDPYLLMRSSAPVGYLPPLIAAARRVNESLPEHVAERVLHVLGETRAAGRDLKVLVCGLAYKGRPVTDDVRGTPARPIIARLKAHIGTVVAHDHLVTAARAAELGAPLVSLDDGATDADAVIFLIDHPGYAALDITAVTRRMRRPAVVLDAWGMFKDQLEPVVDGIVYLRLGRG